MAGFLLQSAPACHVTWYLKSWAWMMVGVVVRRRRIVDAWRRKKGFKLCSAAFGLRLINDVAIMPMLILSIVFFNHYPNKEAQEDASSVSNP